jgi:uncharacterized protein YndB with AHSA1/START domain
VILRSAADVLPSASDAVTRRTHSALHDRVGGVRLPARLAYRGVMPVDVVTEIVVRRPRAEVAAYASDPDNATRWYRNIEAVEWETPRPVAVGSKIAFVARFLGRRLAYTYEVREMVPGERFVMSTAEGPFPMETTYAWDDAPDGGTRMTLRNRGMPAGFSKLAAPIMAMAMRRANGKDLREIKRVLEASRGS